MRNSTVAFLFVVFLAIVFGVIYYTAVTKTSDNTAETKARIEAVTYERDGRTGLCFAVFCWHDETRSVSNVPCTPEVVSRIGGK